MRPSSMAAGDTRGVLVADRARARGAIANEFGFRSILEINQWH